MRSDRDDPELGGDAVVFLGLGGNQGDREGHLRAGLQALDGHPAVQVIRVSRVYETEFVGEGRQDPYLNACAEVRTTLAPSDLLGLLHRIETARGRQPDTHLQPRPLDLDILLFGALVQQDSVLSLPHPRIRERGLLLVAMGFLQTHPGRRSNFGVMIGLYR